MKACLKIRRRRYCQGKRDKGKPKERGEPWKEGPQGRPSQRPQPKQSCLRCVPRRKLVAALFFLIQCLLWSGWTPEDVHAPSPNIVFANPEPNSAQRSARDPLQEHFRGKGGKKEGFMKRDDEKVAFTVSKTSFQIKGDGKSSGKKVALPVVLNNCLKKAGKRGENKGPPKGFMKRF